MLRVVQLGAVGRRRVAKSRVPPAQRQRHEERSPRGASEHPHAAAAPVAQATDALLQLNARGRRVCKAIYTLFRILYMLLLTAVYVFSDFIRLINYKKEKI